MRSNNKAAADRAGPVVGRRGLLAAAVLSRRGGSCRRRCRRRRRSLPLPPGSHAGCVCAGGWWHHRKVSSFAGSSRRHRGRVELVHESLAERVEPLRGSGASHISHPSPLHACPFRVVGKRRGEDVRVAFGQLKVAPRAALAAAVVSAVGAIGVLAPRRSAVPSNCGARGRGVVCGSGAGQASLGVDLSCAPRRGASPNNYRVALLGGVSLLHE